jgi:hypothetical protein
VARKGAKGPIFEGNILPKKFTPKIGSNIGAITGILLRVKISEGCFVLYAPPVISRPYLIIETNSWKIRGVSWESTPARVKASKRGAKF